MIIVTMEYYFSSFDPRLKKIKEKIHLKAGSNFDNSKGQRQILRSILLNSKYVN